jgi:tyrosinase
MADSDHVGEQVVADPTYMADIRFFFRPMDVDHMAAKGLDLGTYHGVKRNALLILGETAPPEGDMPPDAAGKWSMARWQTFHRWIANGCPQGAATPQPGDGAGAPAARVRKDVAALDDAEVATLKKAFTGLMARDPSHPDSYFAIAGQHGLPTLWCVHHEDRFNPWHRVYLRQFEDALRSVDGCADVTIPYCSRRSRATRSRRTRARTPRSR